MLRYVKGARPCGTRRILDAANRYRQLLTVGEPYPYRNRFSYRVRACRGAQSCYCRYYEVARIEPIYLVTGVVAVLLIGQIAVLVPANRAAREVSVATLL